MAIHDTKNHHHGAECSRPIVMNNRFERCLEELEVAEGAGCGEKHTLRAVHIQTSPAAVYITSNYNCKGLKNKKLQPYKI